MSEGPLAQGLRKERRTVEGDGRRAGESTGPRLAAVRPRARHLRPVPRCEHDPTGENEAEPAPVPGPNAAL